MATAVITTLRHRAEPLLFLTVGAMAAVAVGNLVRANRRRAALLRRKRELQS